MVRSRFTSGARPAPGTAPTDAEKRRPGNGRRRFGVTLVEVVAAATLLAALLASSAHVLRMLATEQRAAERRSLALQTTQNIAEQVGNLRWDQLTAEALAQLTIPESVGAHLPGAKLAVTEAEEREPVIAKRVSIELAWNAPNGDLTVPAKLTVWVFPDQPQTNCLF